MTETQDTADPASEIQPFNLISQSERTGLAQIMGKSSGLGVDQIASNPFGFPCIPIPVERTTRMGKIRLAPSNVNDDFIGHPIYWISPEFTTFDPTEETEEQWSVRMFFIIMGMGLWTEDLQWIDYPHTKGYDYSDEKDLEEYRSDAPDSVSKMDDLHILDEDDFEIPAETVYSSYVVATDNLSSMIQSEYGEYLQDYARALAHAKHIFGEDPFNGDLVIDSDDSFWSNQIFPLFDPISEKYDHRFKDEGKNVVLSDLIDEMVQAADKFQGIVRAFDKASSLLSIPIMQQYSSREDTFAYLISYMGLSNETTKESGGAYDLSKPIMEVTSQSDKQHRGAFDENVINAAFLVYESAWRRLRLAFSNSLRLEDEQEPLADYTELEMFIATGTTRSGLIDFIEEDVDQSKLEG